MEKIRPRHTLYGNLTPFVPEKTQVFNVVSYFVDNDLDSCVALYT